MGGEVRILLVDPHAIVREGLRLLIESRAGLVVVGEAADGQKAVEIASRLRPDIVVTELLLPRLSGLEAARHILKADSRTGVLILSVRDSRTAVEEALRAGVSGYVLKSSSPKELIEAIEVVRDGESFLSPTVTHHLVDAVAHPTDGVHSSLSQLTHREREVLQLIAEGNSSKEVATLMGVSLKTVESHRSSLMTKLGIHKVASLVRFAIREGLIEP
jgi:DNA-binding NarL/FixJ family response regulator